MYCYHCCGEADLKLRSETPAPKTQKFWGAVFLLLSLFLLTIETDQIDSRY